MKKTFFILLSVNLFSNEPLDVMDRFIYNYLLLAESKVESSPMVWQDVKEGYLRNYTLRYTDMILDSLNEKKLSPFDAGLRHLPKIENLRIEIKKGGEYHYTITPNDTPRYNINYFYFSIN